MVSPFLYPDGPQLEAPGIDALATNYSSQLISSKAQLQMSRTYEFCLSQVETMYKRGNFHAK